MLFSGSFKRFLWDNIMKISIEAMMIERPMHKIIRITGTAIYTIIFLAPCFCATAGSIPDTGQTKCYNDSVEITCPEPGEDFYGQDAQYLLFPQYKGELLLVIYYQCW